MQLHLLCIRTIISIAYFLLLSMNSTAQVDKNDRAIVYYKEAQKMYQQKKYDEALGYLKDAESTLGSTNGRIMNLKIKAFYYKGDYIRAESAFNKFARVYATTVTPELKEDTYSYMIRIEKAAKGVRQKELQAKLDMEKAIVEKEESEKRIEEARHHFSFVKRAGRDVYDLKYTGSATLSAEEEKACLSKYTNDITHKLLKKSVEQQSVNTKKEYWAKRATEIEIDQGVLPKYVIYRIPFYAHSKKENEFVLASYPVGYVNGLGELKLPIWEIDSIISNSYKTVTKNLCSGSLNDYFTFLQNDGSAIIMGIEGKNITKLNDNWDASGMCSEGVAIFAKKVKHDGRESLSIGIYNYSGKLLSKVDNCYAIRPFTEGLAAIGVIEEKGSTREVKWGYINKEGEFVIPCKYYSAQPFIVGFGMAKVQLRKNSMFKLINKKGEIVPYRKMNDD